jgi:hypothetical protein
MTSFVTNPNQVTKLEWFFGDQENSADDVTNACLGSDSKYDTQYTSSTEQRSQNTFQFNRNLMKSVQMITRQRKAPDWRA